MFTKLSSWQALGATATGGTLALLTMSLVAGERFPADSATAYLGRWAAIVGFGMALLAVARERMGPAGKLALLIDGILLSGLAYGLTWAKDQTVTSRHLWFALLVASAVVSVWEAANRRGRKARSSRSAC